MAENSNRSRNPRRSSTFDVCLLLRAHAESRWLSNELTPVLREIEQRDTISDLQLSAALAYLEVLWIEAGARARETEAARVELDALGAGEQSLPEKARRYHSAVRRLRDGLQRRVNLALSVPADARRSSSASDRQTTDRPASS
jgi:hypothetical protein